MAGYFYKGILLQQCKEPALSRELREFVNADHIGVQMSRPPIEAPEELSGKEILQVAQEANIIDERDGVPLWKKLSGEDASPVQLLLGDAIDDEPYLSSQLNPLLKNQELAAAGLRFAQKATQAAQAKFAVYKNLTDLKTSIPKQIGGFPVSRVRGRYPAEYQASLRLDQEQDVLMIGVCALIHLARAILFNKPQVTAFVTVAGDCVGNPTNLEVSLGVTVAQALERCGLIDDPARVIIGGSMTGISVIDTEKTLITPITRGILAFRKPTGHFRFSCIGCARCVRVCPQNLNPFYLYRSIQSGRIEHLKLLDAQKCIGCGTCSYMCPSKLDLSETIQAANQQFKKRTASINTTRQLSQQARETDKQAFLSKTAYEEQQRLHKKALKEIQRQEKKRHTQAVMDYEQSKRSCDLELEQTLKSIAERLSQRQAAVETAKTDGQRLVNQAQQALDRVVRECEQEIQRAKRTLEKQQARLEKASDAQRQADLKGDLSITQLHIQASQVELEKVRSEYSKALESAQIQGVQMEQNAREQLESTKTQAAEQEAQARLRHQQTQEELENSHKETLEAIEREFLHLRQQADLELETVRLAAIHAKNTAKAAKMALDGHPESEIQKKGGATYETK